MDSFYDGDLKDIWDSDLDPVSKQTTSSIYGSNQQRFISFSVITLKFLDETIWRKCLYNKNRLTFKKLRKHKRL